MSKVVIIDYQLGNIFSVNQALENIGIDVVISSDPADLETADAVVLPGVGAFSDAMKNLRSNGLDTAIHRFIEAGKPFMGVCLGQQLLFSESEEFGSYKGLGLLEGKVKRFLNFNDEGGVVRVPQIAWNEIHPAGQSWDQSPFKSLNPGEDMYFVHSFYVEPSDPACVLSVTTYQNREYASSILHNNIFACQFHPEKSAEKGLSIYKNWASINNLI